MVMVAIAVIFISFRYNRTENIKVGTYVEGTQRFIEEKSQFRKRVIYVGRDADRQLNRNLTRR